MSVLSQLPDVWTTALTQWGIPGVVLGFFMLVMWRDREYRQRQDELRDVREKEWIDELRMNRRSIDDLVRIIGIDVLSRPELKERVERDAQELVDAAKARSAPQK